MLQRELITAPRQERDRVPFLDLSRRSKVQQRQVYVTLLHTWWPHPVHERVRVSFSHDALTFVCACGDQLQLDYPSADALGLLHT